MTKPIDLEAIRERVGCPSARQAVQIGEYEACARTIVEHDAPALVSEVERLRAVAEAAEVALGYVNSSGAHDISLARALENLAVALDAWRGGEGNE